jgi:hypothetical protein
MPFGAPIPKPLYLSSTLLETFLQPISRTCIEVDIPTIPIRGLYFLQTTKPNPKPETHIEHPYRTLMSNTNTNWPTDGRLNRDKFNEDERRLLAFMRAACSEGKGLAEEQELQKRFEETLTPAEMHNWQDFLKRKYPRKPADGGLRCLRNDGKRALIRHFTRLAVAKYKMTKEEIEDEVWAGPTETFTVAWVLFTSAAKDRYDEQYARERLALAREELNFKKRLELEPEKRCVERRFSVDSLARDYGTDMESVEGGFF